jgi:hypothetical protein
VGQAGAWRLVSPSLGLTLEPASIIDIVAALSIVPWDRRRVSRFEKDAIPHGTLMRGNPFAVASAVAATQPGSVTVPISQKRMSEIETELAVIVRELDRIEKARAKRPEQPVPLGAAAVTRSGEVGLRGPSARLRGSPTLRTAPS